MSKAKPGLLEFVQTKRAQKTACPVCKLSQRAEIDEGRKSGSTYPEIQEWLEKHHETKLSDDQLRRHFRQGHHEQKAVTR